MAQKKKLKKVNTQLPPDLLERLLASVERDGTKIQTAFADAVRLYLKARSA